MKAINARRFVRLASKGLRVPEGGWNAGTFIEHGAALANAQHRVARLVQRRSAAVVARIMKRFLDAQLERIINRGLSNHGQSNGKAVKAEFTISIAQNERLWLLALDEVLAEANTELRLELVPSIQSTMGQGYSRTNLLLGNEDTEAARRKLARKLDEVGEKIVGINDTTRERVEKRIKDSVRKGDTVTETAAKLKRELVPINSGRALTVARTEMSNAWNDGAVEAFQSTPGLTHVSVIGCEDREWDAAPQFFYEGEPTCNIEDVPIEDADKLEFHPNHTGVMVASGFDD